MPERSDVQQRREFWRRHQAGLSYTEIAAQMGVSKECIRYWCRRQRDGGEVFSRYGRSPSGLLSHFDPKVRYVLLRLRVQHPRQGPSRLLYHLCKRPSLRGLPLPSETQIGRYLRQWPRFHRNHACQPRRQRPAPPTRPHQRWQLDFKMGIALRNGTLVNLHTIYDPFAKACLAAVVYPAGQVGQAPHKVVLSAARATIRRCFAAWGTLPQEVQTDGETTLVGQRSHGFPSPLTLWLVGLGIRHLVIRPGRPTDNAEVERCHRTICDYAVAGNEHCDCQALQQVLDQAAGELVAELPSRAAGCGNQPPLVAHPELLQKPQPFQREHELALFDLNRVDEYLATYTWERRVSKVGQVELGAHRYSVGRAYAHRPMLARYDPAQRQFVFFEPAQPTSEVARHPALGLEVSDLTGWATEPESASPQQLPLLLLDPAKRKGVYVKEQIGV